MKNLKSTYKVLRTDVELDVKEISYLVIRLYSITSMTIMIIKHLGGKHSYCAFFSKLNINEN